MKVLVKTKSENVILVIPGTRDFVDCHRFRVFDNIADMDRWEARGLIERHYVNDGASDYVFAELFEKNGDKAFDIFVKRYSPSSKVKDVKEEKDETNETEETEEKTQPQAKTTKSYKRR